MEVGTRHRPCRRRDLNHCQHYNTQSCSHRSTSWELSFSILKFPLMALKRSLKNDVSTTVERLSIPFVSISENDVFPPPANSSSPSIRLHSSTSKLNSLSQGNHRSSMEHKTEHYYQNPFKSIQIAKWVKSNFYYR